MLFEASVGKHSHQGPAGRDPTRGDTQEKASKPSRKHRTLEGNRKLKKSSSKMCFLVRCYVTIAPVPRYIHAPRPLTTLSCVPCSRMRAVFLSYRRRVPAEHLAPHFWRSHRSPAAHTVLWNLGFESEGDPFEIERGFCLPVNGDAHAGRERGGTPRVARPRCDAFAARIRHRRARGPARQIPQREKQNGGRGGGTEVKHRVNMFAHTYAAVGLTGAAR